MKAMKRLVALATVMAVTAAAMGQVLVKTHTIDPEEVEMFKERANIDLRNKPNGLFYRLREKTDIEGLLAPAGLEGLECYITDETDNGYVALFRRPTSADDYRFVVVTFDENKKPTGTYNLGALTGNDYCEVQDIRWFDGHLYFNMACPTYSSSIGGRGSKLYDLDLASNEIVWSSKYLVSNDIFLVDQYFVYCGYGFTGEDDFIYLLDRRYGVTLTACPIHTAHEYMQFMDDGRLFVQDYDGYGYIFAVAQQGVRITGTGVRLRMGPSTSSAVLVDENEQAIHPLKGDVLPTWGDEGDFFKVIWNGANYVYVSRRYATTDAMPSFNSCDLPDYGVRAWLGGADDDTAYFEIYDIEKFADAAEINVEDCQLKIGTYRVTIDSPLACGVFIGKCYDDLGIYIESEDCRAFGCSLSRAALTGDFSTNEFLVSDLGEGFTCVDGFKSVTLYDEDGVGHPTVYALSSDGLKSESPLYFFESDWSEDYEYDMPIDQKFNVDCALVDDKGERTNVTLEFETHSNALAGGTITYHRKKGKDSVIRLLGEAHADYSDEEEVNYVKLYEFLDNGRICGEMNLKIYGASIAEGSWQMDNRTLTMVFDEQAGADPCEESELFTSAGKDNVDGTYVWTKKVTDHPILKEYSGTFTLRCEGDSVSFSGCTVMPNTAKHEGKVSIDSDGDFIFSLDDCELGTFYLVRVFRDALFVTTFDDTDGSECFGEGATLSGWYIRKK